MKSEKIKAIIFDLGGVILNIDVPRTALAIARLTGRSDDPFFVSPDFRKVFNQVEAFSRTAEDIREGYFKYFNFRVEDKVFDQAYCELLLDYPPKRYELLKKLKNKLPLYLLSNTNAIHQKYFEQLYRDTFNGDELGALFVKSYYSHDLGDVKPNLSIYQTVLRDANLDPATTLFIDDHPGNIEGAKQAGILTHHLDLAKGEDIVDLQILIELSS